MKIKKTLPLILLITLAAITFGIKQYNNKENISAEGLNRNPSYIHYSKHARCRMYCRHVDENEVKEILTEGKINYPKSESQRGDCDRKYAVEGYSHNRQKLRIIFASCTDTITVITVIDIGTEWHCDCK